MTTSLGSPIWPRLQPRRSPTTCSRWMTLSSHAHAREMPEELRSPEYGPDKEDYALGNLAELRHFFSAARDEGAHVVFNVLH